MKKAKKTFGMVCAVIVIIGALIFVAVGIIAQSLPCAILGLASLLINLIWIKPCLGLKKKTKKGAK